PPRAGCSPVRRFRLFRARGSLQAVAAGTPAACAPARPGPEAPSARDARLPWLVKSPMSWSGGGGGARMGTRVDTIGGTIMSTERRRALRGRAARVAIAVVAAALAATRAFATDYWVKNGGDDGASGTSLAAAWATLGHAANAVGPGDTVHVADGSYEGFYLTTSGTASAPIVFQAEGSDVRI